MSGERLCEAYGEHQAYCSLYGYPLGKDVAELIAAARAAAVAPLEKALRAVWLTSPVNCIPESLLIEIERLLASAPSPVREPEGLDVERLARALCATNIGHYRGWDAGNAHATVDQDHDEEAVAIAAEYARLTPERPADEVDG